MLQTLRSPTFVAAGLGAFVLASGLAIVFTRGAAWPLSMVVWLAVLVLIAQPWTWHCCGRRRDAYALDDSLHTLVPPEEPDDAASSAEREALARTKRAFQWLMLSLFVGGFALTVVNVLTLQFADARENGLWAPYGFCVGVAPFMLFALVNGYHAEYEAGFAAGKTAALREPLIAART